MMKRMIKHISTFVLAVLMVFSLSAAVFAADTSVEFLGTEKGFKMDPASKDLFDNFKNVMPGDELTQKVTVSNSADDCDYIKVYLQAVPLVEEEKENADAVTVEQFLAQLTMRIYNGSEKIYDSTADQADTLTDYVLLGELAKGQSLDLTVELDVPKEMDNKFANCAGQVDWNFLVEAIQFSELTVHKNWDDNGDPDRPESVKVNLLKDGKVAETVVLNEANQWTYHWSELDDRYQWTVEEEAIEGYEVSYKWEDNNVFITNHNDYTPVVEPDPVDLTVKKAWSDENNKDGKRPDSVTVTLYNGNKAVEKVTLSAANNWTYSWKGLDGNGDWSVLETSIPNGYAPAYSTSNGVVTITNSQKLIQTGQLNWPIPVLGCLGVMMVAFGAVSMRKKKNSNA